MKTKLQLRLVFSAFLLLFLFHLGSSNLYAQEASKNKVRLKAEYVKVMNGQFYFDIEANSKVDNQNIDVSDIEILLTNEIGDDEDKLGSVITDEKGKAKFILKSLSELTPDSTGFYNVTVKFKGNDHFSRASKSLSFTDASIDAKLIKKDSVNYITATLKDVKKDSIISGENLNVQIQRLFKPLKIGKEFNYTDEDGSILVQIEDSIPGVDGNLAIEIVLKDSDNYGTLKVIVNAPIGAIIKDESTFDQRTLWSPRNKTPLFFLLFTNILIISIWGIIFYLIYNLVKIKKSN